MERPTSVTVFAVLNMCFGAMGVIFTPIGVLLLVGVERLGLPNPFPDAFSTGPMFVWNVISTAFGFVASALLIAAGVGLFLLKPWARTLSIGYTIYAIASVVVGAVITWLVFIPEITKEIGAQTPAPMVPMMAVSMSFGTCAGLVYPILLLIFMLLPKVASAFKPPPPGPSA